MEDRKISSEALSPWWRRFVHHWYWTGQSNITMALAAVSSAMEVVPLTLLTLDAWDFIKLTRGKCAICGQEISVPHKWAFYFLMAVGVWNFIGAGVFGFLINLPIVSYFEVGTVLTPNHGHAAMMGALGMLALSLLALAIRQVLSDGEWKRKVHPAFFLGFEYWPGFDGYFQPVSRRCASASGCFEEWILACSES